MNSLYLYSCIANFNRFRDKQTPASNRTHFFHLCVNQMTSHVVFNISGQSFYQLRQQQYKNTTQTHNESNDVKKECVFVSESVCVFNSGTAAHKVSLILWQQAHWTTDTELNLLLMKLCSNTRSPNCSYVFSGIGSHRFVCVCVFLHLRFCEDLFQTHILRMFGQSSFIKLTV